MALALVAAVGVSEGANAAAPPPAGVTVPLAPYRAGLSTVEVQVGGRRRRLLFDTGAGVTCISPALARELGCRRLGRVTAHRMSGQRIDLPLCHGVALSLGGVPLGPRTVGILDLGKLLPAGWPKLDGVLALDALADRVVGLDLGGRTLSLAPAQGASAPEGGGWREVPIRLARPAQGAALDVFLRAYAGPQGPIWLELDAGNTGPLIGRHLAAPLGLRPEARQPQPLVLDLGSGPKGSGGVRLTTRALVRDLILDGNLGAAELRRWRIRLDLAARRMWVQPRGK